MAYEQQWTWDSDASLFRPDTDESSDADGDEAISDEAWCDWFDSLTDAEVDGLAAQLPADDADDDALF